MTPTELKAKSDALIAQKKQLEYESEVLDSHLRASCEHKTLLEAPFEESLSGWFAPMPYRRGCEDCGLEEESSWANWRTLTGRAYQVKREEIYRNRRASLARVIDGVIYVGSSPSKVTNDMIINGEPCNTKYDYDSYNDVYRKRCTKVAGHKTYPCGEG